MENKRFESGREFLNRFPVRSIDVKISEEMGKVENGGVKAMRKREVGQIGREFIDGMVKETVGERKR